MAQSYSVTAILSAVDRGFSSAMDKAATATKSLGNTVQEKMGGIGKAVTVAGAATTAMGVSALKSYGTFEQSLNQAAVIAGGTSKDIDGLAKVANKMGKDLPLSAQDAANAMVAMARDGASIGTIKKEFPAIAKAATAAGADLETTASVVQQSMNIWGDSLKSPEQAAGILVSTANMSNASIESMQQALATMGPTATMTGMDMQTVATAIGLLTNKGFSAAQASDDLNHAILQMAAPSKVAQDAMKGLGISYRDAEGNMKPFPQILSEVAQKTDGLGKAQKDAALKALFGTAGMQAIVPLLESVKDKTGKTTTSWDAFSKAMDSATGTTERANKTLDNQAVEMQKNVGSSLEQLGGSWESLRNTSMKSAKGINNSYIGMANQALEWAQNSNSGLAQATRGFIGLSPIIGSAMTAIGGFLTNAGKIGSALSSGITAIKTFGSGVSTFFNVSRALMGVAKGSQVALLALKTMANTSKIAKAGLVAYNAVVKIGTAIQVAFNAVMAINPFILIGVAIAAVIAALVLFFTKTKMGQQIWQNFVSWLSDAWNSLKDLASVIWDAIVQVFSSAVDKVKNVWNTITEFFSNLWQGIISVASDLWNSFLSSISPIIEAFKNLWNALTEFFSALWNAIVNTATTVWNSLIAVITPIVEAFKAIWNVLTEFFSILWQSIVTIASTIWQGLVNIVTSIVEAIKALWSGFSSFMSTIWQGIVNVASSIWNGLVAIITTIWNNIKTVIQTTLSVITTVIQAGINIIQTIWSTIWNIIVTILKGIWDNMVTIVSTVINVLANIIRAITSAIKGDWTGVWNAIKAVVTTVWNGIKTVVQTSINVVRTVVSSVMNAIKSVFSTVWNAIKSVTSSVFNAIKSVVQNSLSTMRSVVSNILNAIINFFKSGWNSAKNATVSGIKGAVNAVKNIGGNMLSAGRNFVMGFVKGVTGAIGSAINAAANMAKKALNAAKSALGIHSPSRVMRDEVGKYIPAGLAVGILSNLSAVNRASDELAEAAIFDVPAVDTTDFTRSISAMNGSLSGGVDSTLTHELSINQQSAYINVSLGGTDYGTFVEDISREQGSQASLKRNYKF